MSAVEAAWTRDVVRVAGPDAEAFLQGQLSQDVAVIGAGQSAWSFVLQPQGKVEVFMRVTRTGPDEFVLDTDAGWADRLVARLNRFKLRTKVDIEPVAAAAAPAATLAVPDWPGFEDDGRPFERRRIEAGFPRMGAEADDTTIPAELGAQVIRRAVSFTKGCYTGQELVARIDSRGGNVPRHLRRLRIDGDPPGSGAGLLFAGDREVGRITSVAAAGGGSSVALGFVARSIEMPAELEVRWAVGTESETGSETGTATAMSRAMAHAEALPD